MTKLIKSCSNCGSKTGPFIASPDGPLQVICSTCGSRGPYQNAHKTAEEGWDTQNTRFELDSLRDALYNSRLTILPRELPEEHMNSIMWEVNRKYNDNLTEAQVLRAYRGITAEMHGRSNKLLVDEHNKPKEISE